MLAIFQAMIQCRDHMLTPEITSNLMQCDDEIYDGERGPSPEELLYLMIILDSMKRAARGNKREIQWLTDPDYCAKLSLDDVCRGLQLDIERTRATIKRGLQQIGLRSKHLSAHKSLVYNQG